MNKTRDDESRFDRLVDGELPADEYRALVASLDEEPGGWRRCALAFLESQALAGELGSVRHSLDLGALGGKSPRVQRPASVESRPAFRFGPFELRTLLAMAASFLVAFALGIILPRWFPTPDTLRPTIAELPAQLPQQGVALTSPNQQPGAGNNIRHESFKPIGNVRLVVDGPGGDSTSVGDLPVYELPGSVEQWLANERPALSAEVLQTLQQRGHQVERHVEYLPVQLEDGRQVIVPVEGYQIRSVSKRPY